MEGRRVAVLIGVNHCGISIGLPALRYAEADARGLRDVLVDPEIGTFESADVCLYVGQQATWHDVKAQLRELALTGEPSDVLLVYFAGHAAVPIWSGQDDVYLATADFDLPAVRTAPDDGLRLSFLRRDVFELFAGTSFLILDCCHAGAYVDTDRRHTDAIGMYGRQLDRHSALLSCPPGTSARENDRYRHGVLTYHLLRALRGEAAGPDGRVSFAQMANFAAEQSIHPSPGQLVQMWGPTTILTQPRASRRDREQPLTEPAGTGRVVPCENPLERFSSTVHQLLARIFRSDPRGSRYDGAGRAERLRDAVEADAVGVIEFSESGTTVVDATARFGQPELQPLLEQCAPYVFPARTASFGHIACDPAGRRILCVPLSHDECRALVLTVVDPALSLLEMGELLTGLLQAAWSVDMTNDRLHGEVRVLTELRAVFGRLPLSLYDHCFHLYRQLVDSLVMVFQPVISLDRRWNGVAIHSYEALARRAEGELRAPVSILRIAHEWGDRFIIERDAVLLNKAIQSYTQADIEAPWDVTKPISINVAVRSLLSDGYLGVMRNALHEVSLDPRVVTLEISEQDPIRPRDGEVWPQEPLVFFHRRLTQLARDLEISFAVDDFGVGYSSLARMAELPLTQIKVDRAVLHHPMALDELELVMRVARYSSDLGHAPSPRVVIVEGFDHESPVTLHQLYHKRIRYVQGFIAEEPAATSLRPLNNAVRERIAALVRGEHD